MSRGERRACPPRRCAPRDERGAVAVMVGFLSVLLFAVGALSVDLGNAWARKRQVQKQVDVAALSVGRMLPMTTANRTAILAEVAATLADSDNRSLGQQASITAAALDNGSDADGEVYFQDEQGAACATDCERIRVVAPGATVQFTVAGIVGSDSTTVQRAASAQVKSPVIRSLPFYAFTGCDLGGQTIAQPANGHAADELNLAYPAQTNAATLTGLVTSPATDPPSVPVGVTDPGDVITVNGSNLGSVDAVGFFQSGIASTGPEPEIVASSSGAWISGTSTAVSVRLPSSVTSTQSAWYVRVRIGTNWSAVTSAQLLQVGSPTLTCGQGSSSGNFGTLQLPNRSAGAPTGQAENIAFNIATDIQYPVVPYPSPHPDWRCDASDPAAVLWPSGSNPPPAPVNCIGTKTGLDLNAAQMGFLEGVAGKPGRLTNLAPDTGCAADGVPARTSTLPTESGASVTLPAPINNDTLSCFFSDPSVNVGAITGPAYPFDHPVLSAAIYESPRFALVPVLGVQPSNGGSERYQVVGMRPGFITDQPMTATAANPQRTASNGVVLADRGQHKISSMQMIFFQPGALPPPPEGGAVMDYIGSGVKVLRLVD